MTISSKILSEAQAIALHQKQRAAALYEEYLALIKEADDIKAQCDSARSAPKRLFNFKVQIGGDYQCPSCWIISSLNAPIRPVPSQDRSDKFRCASCGHEFSF